jgi:hypothetical protein
MQPALLADRSSAPCQSAALPWALPQCCLLSVNVGSRHRQSREATQQGTGCKCKQVALLGTTQPCTAMHVNCHALPWCYCPCKYTVLCLTATPYRLFGCHTLFLTAGQGGSSFLGKSRRIQSPPCHHNTFLHGPPDTQDRHTQKLPRGLPPTSIFRWKACAHGHALNCKWSQLDHLGPPNAVMRG